jgi:hypothetical protein
MGSFSTFVDNSLRMHHASACVRGVRRSPFTELIKSPPACLPVYLRDDVLGVIACPWQR